MESVENKFIYLKVREHGNANAGRHCAGKHNSGRAKCAFWKEILIPVFPVETKEFRWLGYDVMAYVIYADVRTGTPGRERGCSLRECLNEKRFHRTLETISRSISEQGRDQARLFTGGAQWLFMERTEGGWTEALLSERIGGGAEQVFLAEMVYRFFGETVRAHRRNAGIVEQLILIAPDREEESVSEYLEEALLLSYRLYPEYNYMTILTDQPALFEAVMAEAAEESGLYIRCMAKEKNVLFPDKRTAILDLDRELAPCYRHFPEGAVYVTPWDSSEKKRRLQAKCPQIACFSMMNDLDTVLYNTV